MIHREKYMPGPANAAHLEKDRGEDGKEKWTLVLVKELRHSREKVWQAITDPAHLREWAPFDADGNLGAAGTSVKLETVGAPGPRITETKIKRADVPELLEYSWGDFDMRWKLEAHGGGTRLTLWTNIGQRFMSWGAAAWQICFDVLDFHLSGNSIGRIAGPAAMKFEGWQRLNAEYAKQFAAEIPGWAPMAVKEL
jgi:uncharacterized protein YndB with AHSA1/START domain